MPSVRGGVRPYVQLALAMVIVGSYIVMNKRITEVFPVALASELRLLIGGVLFLIVLAVRERRWPRLSKRDAGVLFVQSLLGVVLFSWFLLHGLRHTTAIESGILTSATPAVVGLLAVVLFREKMRASRALGILLALLGTLTINLFSVTSGTSNGAAGEASAWYGNWLVLAAVVGEAVFLTFGKLVSDRVSALARSTLLVVLGAVLFLPFAIPEALAFDWHSVTLLDWGLILYSGVIATFAAVPLMTASVAHIPSSSTAILSALMPVSAVAFSTLFLQEAFHWHHGLGIALVLLGIVTLARQDK